MTRHIGGIGCLLLLMACRDESPAPTSSGEPTAPSPKANTATVAKTGGGVDSVPQAPSDLADFLEDLDRVALAPFAEFEAVAKSKTGKAFVFDVVTARPSERDGSFRAQFSTPTTSAVLRCSFDAAPPSDAAVRISAKIEECVGQVAKAACRIVKPLDAAPTYHATKVAKKTDLQSFLKAYQTDEQKAGLSSDGAFVGVSAVIGDEPTYDTSEGSWRVIVWPTPAATGLPATCSFDVHDDVKGLFRGSRVSVTAFVGGIDNINSPKSLSLENCRVIPEAK